MKLKCSASIDLSKYILSLMVVAIHVASARGFWYELMIPVLRLAVPLFFMISGYLLFVRMKELDHDKQNEALMKYLFRILKLYLAWLILLFPVTVWNRKYFSEGIFAGLKKILKGFVFGSTFPASWYLMALIIGTALVYIGSRYMGNCVVFIVGTVLYIICCLLSNYGNFCGSLRVINGIYPTAFFNSFPVAIIWISLGKVFAEHEELSLRLAKVKSSGAVLSILLLYCEWFLIKYFRTGESNDCYFMLVPCAVFIFTIIITGTREVRFARQMRMASTITYCMHISIALILDEFINFGEVFGNLVLALIIRYLLVVLLCMIASYFIIKIAEAGKCRIVRYLY